MKLPPLPHWLVADPEQFGVTLARLAVTLIVALALQRLGFLLVRRIERWLARSPKDRPRAHTLAQTTRHLITTAVGMGALLHGLAVLGWDVRPFLVGASILGAALGFGAQWLVRDVIAGVFILIEDQYAVGDAIEVNGVTANVEDVTLRSTRLRDFQGRLMFVPNGEMRIVLNHGRDWHRTIVDLPLAPNQDLGRALEAAQSSLQALAADEQIKPWLLEPPQLLGIERVDTAGPVLRVAVRTPPGAGAALAAREARRVLLRDLLAAGVRMSGDTVVQAGAPESPGAPPAR